MVVAEISPCLGVLEAEESVCLYVAVAETSACLGVVVAVLLTIVLGDALAVFVVEYCDCVRMGDTDAVGHASAWHSCGLEVFVKHIRIAVWQAIRAGSQHVGVGPVVGLAPGIGLAPMLGHASA